MKAYFTQLLPFVLLLFSLYASVELARLIFWYEGVYVRFPGFYGELALITLGLVGQVWGLVLLFKRWWKS